MFIFIYASSTIILNFVIIWLIILYYCIYTILYLEIKVLYIFFDFYNGLYNLIKLAIRYELKKIAQFYFIIF